MSLQRTQVRFSLPRTLQVLFISGMGRFCSYFVDRVETMNFVFPRRCRHKERTNGSSQKERHHCCIPIECKLPPAPSDAQVHRRMKKDSGGGTHPESIDRAGPDVSTNICYRTDLFLRKGARWSERTRHAREPVECEDTFLTRPRCGRCGTKGMRFPFVLTCCFFGSHRLAVCPTSKIRFLSQRLPAMMCSHAIVAPSSDSKAVKRLIQHCQPRQSAFFVGWLVVLSPIPRERTF